MSSVSGFLKGNRALMAAAKAAAPKPSAAKPKPPPPPSKASSSEPEIPLKYSRRPAGIFKAVPVSPALRQFLGVPEVARPDATKKIWEYIKLHNLQTPADKRVIICDDKLKTIFQGKEKIGFLEIAKLLSPHFVKTG